MKRSRVVIAVSILITLLLLAVLLFFLPPRRTVERAVPLSLFLFAILLAGWCLLLPGTNFDLTQAARRLFFPLLAALIPLAAVPYFLLARLNLASERFVIDRWEKTLYFQALDFSSSLSMPYRSPDLLPLISDAYPPLFPVISGFLFLIFPPAPLVPKLLSLGAFLGTLAFLLRELRRSRLPAAAVMLGVAVFLTVSAPYAWLWARTDALVSFLTFAILFSLKGKPNKSRLIMAGLLWLLAVYTKQTAALWLPFILLTVYIQRKSLKIVSAFGIMAGGAAVLIFLVIEVATEGWFSFWTIAVPGRHPYFPLGTVAVQTVFRLFFLLGPVPAALLLAAVITPRPGRISGLRELVGGNRQLLYWGAASVYGAAISTLSCLKSGTAYNQYQDVFAPVAVLTAVLFGVLTRGRTKHSRFPRRPAGLSAIGYAVLFAALLFSASHFWLQSRASYIITRGKAQLYQPEELRELAEEIHSRGWSRVYFPQSTAPERSRTVPGFQEYFASRTDWRAYIDEGALTDLQAAGYSFPSGLNDSLRRGEIEQIVVRVSHLVFQQPCDYAAYPNARCIDGLFPASTRSIFNKYFREISLDTPGFDAYVYHGAAQEER